MSQAVQAVVTGLGSGAIYAIIGMGFSVVFKSSRVVNFAHGEYLVAAGIFGSMLQRSLGWPLLPTLAAVVVLGVLLGLATQQAAVRFLRRPDAITVTIATVAVSGVIETVLLDLTGGKTYGLDEWPGLSFSVDGVAVSSQTSWDVLLACALAGAVSLFFTRTRRGIALQAAADDRDTATLFGVSYLSTTVWTFAIAGALGAFGGVALTSVAFVSFSSGFLFGLKGFAAAMLGGLGSMPGALAGGLVIGLAESFFATYGSSTYAPIVAFAVLLVTLVFKPSGLFKGLTVERV